MGVKGTVLRHIPVPNGLFADGAARHPGGRAGPGRATWGLFVEVGQWPADIVLAVCYASAPYVANSTSSMASEAPPHRPVR